MIMELLIVAIITVLIFVISALPLYFAVLLFGGKTSITKAVIINLISGIAVAIINFIFNTWGGAIAFVVLVWIYREAFRLKWWKSVLTWVLELVFIVALYIIIGFLLVPVIGVSLFL